MMMGTADEIVKAPEKGPVFMEDLPEEEQVVVAVMPFFEDIYSFTPFSSLCLSSLLSKFP